jgi:ssDNA-binding Zn-finger/Zn-ribbon topoisomerase 1
MDKTLKCPKCQSDVLYKYGTTESGRKRYLCLMCNRQFVENPSRARIQNRPDCPKCGRHMHLYRRYKDFLRFRCSNYPECRTYVKLSKKELQSNELLVS